MKFTGQVRIPDLDHPGVPATLRIEGVQAEIILEGDESLGRWSLFDMHARRLISAAFQIEADGEEITFIADEPIDFAYRGVEKMAEVWARFKSMNVIRRKVAVSRSRKGTLPSRVSELRAAMEENLGIRDVGQPLAGTGTVSSAASVSDTGVVAESAESEGTLEEKTTGPAVAPEEEPAIPLVSAPPPEEAPIESLPTEEKPSVEESAEAARLAAERKALEEERAQLEQERQRLQEERRELEKLEAERKRLEDLHREAEQREANRVEAFRLEIQRLEQEREELERLETERQASLREAMEQLEAERGEMQKKSEDHTRRETEDAERAADLQAKLADLEEERVRREREEAERVAAARREMRVLEEQQRRLETIEESREVEIAEQEDAAVSEGREEPAVASTEPEPEKTPELELEQESETEDELLGEGPETEEGAGVLDLAELEEQLSGEEALDEELPEEEQPSDEEPPDEEPPEEEPPTGPKHLRKEPEPEPEPEPAMAGAAKQGSGIMGAVRAAFGRGGREHVHDFVEAPGGIGIARSICRECGYVSISTED